jgi:glycosyltransferase involved in cell wall biosynthesis
MINIHLYPSVFLNEARVLREADTLDSLNIFDRIDLVGAGGSGLPEREPVTGTVSILRLERRDGQRGLVAKALFMLRWSVSVFRLYRKSSVSCINCHSLSTLPVGVLLKHVTGAKLVYDTHELETEANGLKGVRKYISKQVERRLIGYADYSVFVGSLIREWYKTAYDLANTEVIYNCPRLHDAIHSDYFHNKYGIPPELPIFIYQGVISKGRGIESTVDAFSSLENTAALVVMGYGPLEHWVRNKAGEHSNIFYHPAVPPAELLSYTGAADYGLSIIESTALSYEYCMPNKLFEYAMARKPVLVSPTREQKNFVELQNIGIVVENTSPESIRKGVLRILGTGRQGFQAGLESTVREYNWETQETKLKRIYQEMLAGSNDLQQVAGTKTT